MYWFAKKKLIENVTKQNLLKKFKISTAVQTYTTQHFMQFIIFFALGYVLFKNYKYFQLQRSQWQ